MEHSSVSRPGRLGVLRLFVGLASVALATLNVVRAPTYLLWLLSVVVSEWGHWLALVGLAPLLPGWWRTRSGRVGAGCGLLAVLLSLLPLLRAIPIARQLPAQLAVAFGAVPPRASDAAPARAAPLVPGDLWLGIHSPPVRQRQVVYVARGTQSLTLDLFLPPTAQAPAPGILVIHGGGWESGDSSQLASLNDYLAARGYVVAAMNYRLAPQHPFPAARDDVLAALSYLQDHAADVGLDAERLVLLGRSAGGQLALLVAYTANDSGIRGAVALYAPADLYYGYTHPTNPAVLNSTVLLENYLGGPPEQVRATYDAASPIMFVGPATPPTLLIHGAMDELVFPTQSERLAARLAAAGRPHLLLRLPWATHGCDANLSGPAGQISTYAIERFVAAVTGEEDR